MDNDEYDVRHRLSASVNLLNFNRNARGPCNNRDAPILGKNPGINLPSHFKNCDHVLVSLFLHHQLCDASAHKFRKHYIMPQLLDSNDVDIDDRQRNIMPIGAHQQWVSSSNSTIHWKKRKWQLSRNFKDVSGVKFPKFVFVLTPCVQGIIQHENSVRTCAFEVGSKEQRNKSNFSRGEQSTNHKKRRTPETERAALELRAIQADILRITEEISKKKQIRDEYQSRIDFALAISKLDPSAQKIQDTISQYIANNNRFF